MISKTDGFKVVINHEEQYSIIPITEQVSRGWREIGKTGTKSVCLKYIEEVWTDMRPSDKERILKQLGR
jgi:MbtH protein